MEMLTDPTVPTAFFLCTTVKSNLEESYPFFSWLLLRKKKQIHSLYFEDRNNTTVPGWTKTIPCFIAAANIHLAMKEAVSTVLREPDVKI